MFITRIGEMLRQESAGFLLLIILGGGVLSESCAPPHSTRPLLSASPSAADDDNIYVADARGRIRALRSDGSEQWSFSVADEIARRDNGASRDIRIDYLTARSVGKIFGLATELTGGHAGKTILFALDGDHLLWEVEAPYPEQSVTPIAVGPAALYEAGDDGSLYTFSKSDGHQLWKYEVGQGRIGSPTVGSDGTVFVTGPRHNLHALSPDGKQLWVSEIEK